MGAPAELDRCPIMPNFGPPKVMFDARLGHRAVGRRGPPLPGLPRRPGRGRRPGPRPSRGGRGAGHARPPRCVHVSSLFATEHAWHVALDIDRLVGDGSRAGGQVFFCNSGAEANEAAIKLARKWAGHGRFGVGHHLRLVPRPHARHAGRHRPAHQARAVRARCPTASATSPSTTSPPSRRPIDETVAAILLEPIQGEGGVNPASRGVPPARPAAWPTSATSCSCSTRCRPAWAAPAAGSASSTTASPRRGLPGQGARQRRPHRGAVGPGRRRRRLQARRPRFDLLGPAAGHGRRPQGARGDAARRPRPAAPPSWAAT